MQKMTISQLVQNAEMIELVTSWSVQSDRATFAKMYCDFFFLAIISYQTPNTR